MSTFRLTVSTPDGDKFKDDVYMISLRGCEGDLAVMAGHIPFITSVKPCICKIEFDNGDEKRGRIEDGLLTVGSGSVTLLTSSVNWE